MANIRHLKRDIAFLSSQIISDCIDFVQTFNGKEMEAMAVIDQIVELHNSTLDKINHPDGKDNPKLVKAFYQQLKKNYIAEINEAYKKLEDLVK